MRNNPVFDTVRKPAVLLCLLAFVGVIVLIVATVKIKHSAYHKIEPYALSIKVTTDTDARVFLAYDYGAGIRDPHIRPLDLSAGENSLALSLSAWKTVSGLYFIAPKTVAYRVNHLTISKNGVTFAPDLPAQGPTLEGDNWLTRLPLTGFNH